METRVLIDSNIYIGFLRKGQDPFTELDVRLSLLNVVCCGVVKAEVMRGIKSMRLRTQMERFFSIVQMVGTSARLWDEVWQLSWKLDRQGSVLPLTDIIIACCALREGAAVMTNDRHFDQIPGLRVIRPD